MTYAPAIPEREASLMTFEDFLAWHPEDGCQFELINGMPEAMPNPKGPHEDICGFLILILGMQLMKLDTAWYVPKSAQFSPIGGKQAISPMWFC